MPKLLSCMLLLPLAACASTTEIERRGVTGVVPESYISKAWTVRTDSDVELRVTFWRPDVFRIEAGLKVADTNVTTKTEISASGQYITTTNAAYTVAYADPKNDPKATQIILPEIKEDASRVYFKDSTNSYEWATTALTLTLDKQRGTFSCALKGGETVWEEVSPIAFVKAATTNDTDSTVQTLKSSPEANYFGGGQQNGSFIHTGKKIDILADCKWDEGGHPNLAPWVMARVKKDVYYGILRHTFSQGAYDFSGKDAVSYAQSELRFDAFYFIGTSFNRVLDRYTEFTGRPNFIPVWGLELGDAWMTRDKDTKEPKQNADLSYVETTLDVVERNAERYRAADMPGGWLLLNDGYGSKYMQLAWVVDALKSLGFKTGLWTDGALDRLGWEIGTAGTRVQKIDVAWSGPAYQHGLNCNKMAYDGFMEHSDARPFIWTCQGWAGTQRYGVCWTGDQYGNFDLIRYHVPTVTGSGMSGQAYATTDIDGIFGGSNESFLRDLQWKCFTPAMYVMNGWSDVNKAPWSYPEPYKSIIRSWLKWKLRITPYMYTTCREAWETGAPIVRPLVWNYPDDSVALSDKVNYQMMLGRDFLVSPVFDPQDMTEGWYTRNIYFPEGVWYDYNDGRRITGAGWLGPYPVTLETLPVFVRGGAIIPMYPEALYSTQVPKDTVTFDIWPDGESEYTWYEDDGETRAYQKGEWSRQTIRVSAPKADDSGDVAVEIGATFGKGFKGQIFKRAYELWLHTASQPTQVLVDGVELLAISATNAADRAAIYANSPQCWFYDAADKGGTVKIKLAKRCIKTPVSVAVNCPVFTKPAAEEYGQPPPEVSKRMAEAAKRQYRTVATMNAENLYQQAGGEYKIDLDGTWKQVVGSVVCSKDTHDDAVVSFRITTDEGKVIFERVGQKGRAAAQVIAVNIPETAKSLTFTFNRDADTPNVPALGVWKELKLAK